ncbi:MAG TPA: cyclic nucleotide-binding domain-containing protein [Candidatus Saccharimonadales bacterium]|jgi:CRP/FNR family cyclic AMP-dependent transcriptional regulator|nr:cyclic nucleotide-binding domain-containing protein [Candidatus Saccharimonadales bacterium]
MADARAARLKAVPLFAHCDKKQIDFIATQVEEMDFPAGRVLCTEGMYGGDFFILESGAADVTRGGNKIATMQSGDFFGEIALVDGGRRTATVTTTTPSRAFVLGPRQFQNVLHQNVEVIHSVMKALATRIREAGAAKAD